MNLVIDDAIEVGQVTKTNETETRRPLGMIPRGVTLQMDDADYSAGRILLKGDNVSLIQSLSG